MKKPLLFKSETPKVCIEKPPIKRMSTQIDPDTYFQSEQFERKLPHYYRSILSSFRKTSTSFVLFHLLFLSIGVVESALFFAFFSHLSGAVGLAIVLSTFFLTLFSYLVLLFYYTQAKKPEQLNTLVHEFMTSCRSSLRLFPETASHHLPVADALVKLSHYLDDYEGSLLQISDRFPKLTQFFSQCSVGLYWRDVFHFKKALLQAAIQEHLHQIRLTPTDLELHASLANAYIALSQIHKEPEATSPRPYLNFYKKHKQLFGEKFKLYGQLAIEEFKILNDFAPNDPWIHEQLAAGYRALSMPQEEMKAIELLLKLRPNDKEASFQLATLYFALGLNAKGLQIYEELQRIGFKKTEQLIASYGKFVGA